MARPTRAQQLEERLECEVDIVDLDRVRAAQAAIPGKRETEALAAVFAAMGDPTRLRIVAALADNELCVCDIAAAVRLTTSAVSHQLKVLRGLGLVRPRR